MSDQTLNDRIKADLAGHDADANAILLASAASTYAYNKINNLLLMQVLATVENRDLEDIRNNVERYIAEFSAEYVDMNSKR